MKQRFAETQILGFLREAAAGTSVKELCWNHCFSRSTFRAWKAKYGEAIHAKTERLKQLDLENAHLRKALARVSADIDKIGPRCRRGQAPDGAMRSCKPTTKSHQALRREESIGRRA